MHWEDPEGWDGEGGSGWGTHVNPWLIHVNVWQKPLQYCKVISLQLIKINEKKIKTCNHTQQIIFMMQTYLHDGKIQFGSREAEPARNIELVEQWECTSLHMCHIPGEQPQCQSY